MKDQLKCVLKEPCQDKCNENQVHDEDCNCVCLEEVDACGADVEEACGQFATGCSTVNCDEKACECLQGAAPGEDGKCVDIDG